MITFRRLVIHNKKIEQGDLALCNKSGGKKMGQKRVFIGTFVPQSLLEKHIIGIKENFDKVSTHKWVEYDNLHISYKFLGNIDEEKIPELKSALSHILKRYDSPIYFNKLACIPNHNNPRALYSKIYSPKKLVHHIFDSIEKITTTQFDFPKEKRRFTPHLTLSRIKQIEEGFTETLAEYDDMKMGYMKFFRVNLIASNLTPERPIYEIL